MKRIGHVMELIAEPDNLRLAFWRASRAKSAKAEVLQFRARLEDELIALRQGLLDGNYPVGRFQRFIVHDPKERVIHAPCFRERVLHHAIINVCEPVFERWLILDSYACRKGKGQWAAVRRAERFAARASFYLKFDVRKYFDSVSHERLMGMLRGRFKDPILIRWFERLLGTYHTQPGHGLPIGSLTSQHLANFYLGALDRFVKEELRCRYYVRYMDDCVIWAEESERLREVLGRIEEYVAVELDLTLKPVPYINRATHGMDFLGCRVFPGYSTLNRRSRRRFRSKLRRYETHHEDGVWDEACLQRHVEPLLAFTRQVRAWGFRSRVLKDLGARPIGLQPREPRGQLEQQRPELPVSEP